MAVLTGTYPTFLCSWPALRDHSPSPSAIVRERGLWVLSCPPASPCRSHATACYDGMDASASFSPCCPPHHSITIQCAGWRGAATGHSSPRSQMTAGAACGVVTAHTRMRTRILRWNIPSTPGIAATFLAFSFFRTAPIGVSSQVGRIKYFQATQGHCCMQSSHPTGEWAAAASFVLYLRADSLLLVCRSDG